MTYSTEELGKMLDSVLMNMDAIIYVDRFAVGANDGGRYVSLYNSNLNLRLLNVYHERFYSLPPFIKDRIEELADDMDVPVKLAVAERQNRIHTCPKFKATRYRRPIRNGEDATSSNWKFGAVVRVLNQNRDKINQNGSNGRGNNGTTPDPDPVATADQLDVLRDLMRVIFDEDRERQSYLESCLSKFGCNTMSDLKSSQVLMWKKYLDERLQAKFRGISIVCN